MFKFDEVASTFNTPRIFLTTTIIFCIIARLCLDANLIILEAFSWLPIVEFFEFFLFWKNFFFLLELSYDPSLQ